MSEYCNCRISSPSAHHSCCINDGCGKKIKTIYEKYSELEQKLKEANQEIKELYSGRLGACHTCEQVAELNIKLEQQLKEAERQLDKIESFAEEKSKDKLISGYGYIAAMVKNYKIQKTLL